MTDFCTPSALTGRLPIIVLGDSDCAAGYLHASTYPENLQRQQKHVTWAHHMYCHQGTDPATWTDQDSIVPLGPFTCFGETLRAHWLFDLGIALVQHGVPATFLAYPVGSTTFDSYSPTVNPEAYATRLAWLSARLGEMPRHQEPIIVWDYGIAGVGTGGYTACADVLLEALTDDLGYPNLQVVVMRVPLSLGENEAAYADTRAAQDVWVAANPTSVRVAYNETCTYINDGTLEEGLARGAHFDGAGGRKFAIGPDDASTVSILTALRQLLALRGG